jgi:hypothetical protein
MLSALGVEEAQRLRAELAIDVRLTKPTRVGPSDQPSHSLRPDSPRPEKAEDPVEDRLLGTLKGRETRAADSNGILDSQALGSKTPGRTDPIQETPKRTHSDSPLKTYREIDLASQGSAPFKCIAVLAEMPREKITLPMFRVKGRERATLICGRVEASRNPNDLKVRLDRVGECLKALAYFDLSGFR